MHSCAEFRVGITTAFLLVQCLSVAGDCVQEPTTPSCEGFEYPYASQDLGMLCGSMPNMPGCTIGNICKATTEVAGSEYCETFSILKDICVEDMPMMSGCKNYSTMCAESSVVKECNDPFLPLPTSMEAAALVNKICQQMSMEPCAKCPNGGLKMECDLLSVYSELCVSMPDMTECSKWSAYCRVIPDWPICSHGSHPSAPMMRMYFHTGFEDYVLFKGWVPRTLGQYIGSIAIVFIAGIIGEVLKVVRSIMEKKWESEENTMATNSSLEPLIHASHRKSWREFLRAQLGAPFEWRKEFIRAVLQFFEVAWGLLIMLVAMTFNVGLFLSVCFGAAFGSLLVGRYAKYEAKASCH